MDKQTMLGILLFVSFIITTFDIVLGISIFIGGLAGLFINKKPWRE